MTDDAWIPLHGGYVNTVARRGRVVRRQKSAASPAVHALLRHLEARGLPLTPRLLGQGAEHEYLGYLPGEAVFRPWPKAVLTEAWLADLGRWLRTYHGVVAGFRVEAAFSWGPARPAEGMVVTHGDLGPWNLLHTGGRLSGVIDWDLARYGDPLDDVAELALEAVPLHARLGETLGEAATGAELEARLELFCRAYGVTTGTVRRHLPVYLETVIGDVQRLATAGTEPFASFERGGVVQALKNDLADAYAAPQQVLIKRAQPNGETV